MGHNYPKKILVVYLKFKCNWASHALSGRSSEDKTVVFELPLCLCPLAAPSSSPPSADPQSLFDPGVCLPAPHPVTSSFDSSSAILKCFSNLFSHFSADVLPQSALILSMFQDYVSFVTWTPWPPHCFL